MRIFSCHGTCIVYIHLLKRIAVASIENELVHCICNWLRRLYSKKRVLQEHRYNVQPDSAKRKGNTTRSQIPVEGACVLKCKEKG